MRGSLPFPPSPSHNTLFHGVSSAFPPQCVVVLPAHFLIAFCKPSHGDWNRKHQPSTTSQVPLPACPTSSMVLRIDACAPRRPLCCATLPQSLRHPFIPSFSSPHTTGGVVFPTCTAAVALSALRLQLLGPKYLSAQLGVSLCTVPWGVSSPFRCSLIRQHLVPCTAHLSLSLSLSHSPFSRALSWSRVDRPDKSGVASAG